MADDTEVEVVGDYSAADDYKVSVFCTTYNHERYLRQCLDSLLAQETDFTYRIIVHDDQSTDATVDILREYAAAHPEKIVLVLEKKNVYSRGMDIDSQGIPYLKADFVAICEGDDWWLDKHKLQRQYDYMIAHPECALCVHRGAVFYDPIGKFVASHGPGTEERDFATEDIIMGTGDMFVTNSMFYPTRLFGCPEPFLHWGLGDFPTMLFLSLHGTVHYLPQVMSAYRMSAQGSWNVNQKNMATEKLLARRENYLSKINGFDEYTEGRYHDTIERYLKRYRFVSAVPLGDWKRAKQEADPDYFRSLSMKQRLEAWLKCTHPRTYYALADRIQRIHAARYTLPVGDDQ